LFLCGFAAIAVGENAGTALNCQLSIVNCQFIKNVKVLAFFIAVSAKVRIFAISK